jgi:hypothetical protein
VEQLTLDLFTPRSFTDLLAYRKAAGLSVHVNRRLRNSWYVKIHRGSDARDLYLPPCFEDAPEAVKTALIDWALLPPRTRNRSVHGRTAKELRRCLELSIRHYMENHGAGTTRRKAAPSQKWPTKGCRYDLREVFDTINRHYFNSCLTSFLRWGATASKLSFQATRKGPDGIPYHCITIAGTYDHPDVPRFAIEAIMYHEMLHIHLPPRNERGRRVIHGADFKKMEQAFPHYRSWRLWERESFHRLRSGLRRTGRKTLLQRAISLLPGV